VDLPVQRVSRLDLSTKEKNTSAVFGGLSGMILRPPAHVETTNSLSDYGGWRKSTARYLLVEPSRLEDLQATVLWANGNKLPIRIRGNGHSMNGSSVPRADELLVSMRQCRHFRFEEEGTITAGAGAAIWDVNAVARKHGFRLLVWNDGASAASSVGGYLSAGGFGSDSRSFGGFWETVNEISMVAGNGRILRITRTDPEFRWIFGSMGQLGIAFELKLRILPCAKSVRPYPAGVNGLVERSESQWEPILWYTLFVPASECTEARRRIIAIGAKYRHAWRGRWPYSYPIRFQRFNPPLIHQVQESLMAIGIWGTPHASGFDREAIGEIEMNVDQLAAANPQYRRYIQSELTPEGYDLERYWGPTVYSGFALIKRALDPAGVMVPGLLKGA
jgi:FAD/FMN-containing dehydrogenase